MGYGRFCVKVCKWFQRTHKLRLANWTLTRHSSLIVLIWSVRQNGCRCVKVDTEMTSSSKQLRRTCKMAVNLTHLVITPTWMRCSRRSLNMVTYNLSSLLWKERWSAKMKEKDRGRKPQKGNMHLGHWVISLVFCLFLFFFFKYTLTV